MSSFFSTFLDLRVVRSLGIDNLIIDIVPTLKKPSLRSSIRPLIEV